MKDMLVLSKSSLGTERERENACVGMLEFGSFQDDDGGRVEGRKSER